MSVFKNRDRIRMHRNTHRLITFPIHKSLLLQHSGEEFLCNIDIYVARLAQGVVINTYYIFHHPCTSYFYFIVLTLLTSVPSSGTSMLIHC